MKWPRRITMRIGDMVDGMCTVYPVDKSWYKAFGEYTATVCGESMPDLLLDVDYAVGRAVCIADEVMNEKSLIRILEEECGYWDFDTDPVWIVREYALKAEKVDKEIRRRVTMDLLDQEALEDGAQEEPKPSCAECYFAEGPPGDRSLFRCTYGNLMVATLIDQIPDVDKEMGCRHFVRARKAKAAVFVDCKGGE